MSWTQNLEICKRVMRQIRCMSEKDRLLFIQDIVLQAWDGIDDPVSFRDGVVDVLETNNLLPWERN